MSNYKSWGYNDFLTRTIVIPKTQTPLEARNTIPTGSLSASQLSFQFIFDSVFEDSTESEDSETAVDMPDMTLTFNLVQPAKLLILFNATIFQVVAATIARTHIRLDIDGSPTDDDITIGGAVAAGEVGLHSAVLHSVQELADGEHTIKIQWWVSNDTVAGWIADRRLTYLLLSN